MQQMPMLRPLASSVYLWQHGMHSLRAFRSGVPRTLRGILHSQAQCVKGSYYSSNTLVDASSVAGLDVQQVPGSGRGLFAKTDIQYGAVIHRESPLLCVPSQSNPAQICYHCLKVIAPTHLQVMRHPSGHVFCSSTCLQQAGPAYLAVEAACDFTALHELCSQQQERFPLLAARLACLELSSALEPAALQQLMQQQGMAAQQASDTGAAAQEPAAGAAASGQAGGGPPGTPAAATGQLLQQHLCFANVPKPYPEPWVQAHALLQQGISSFIQSHPGLTDTAAVTSAATKLDIDWYVAVMSRVHINAFRVESLMPLTFAAADLRSGINPLQADAGSDPTITGTAVYLLASLLNHSCDPSVNVTFPRHDAEAVFTAARDIAAGEQLSITYTDAEAGVQQRQQVLHWSYGFRCRCQKCVEELQELGQ